MTPTALSPSEASGSTRARRVIDAEHDDAADLAPQQERIGAARKGLRHPVHVAVLAFGDPGGEMIACPRRQTRGGDAAKIKAERTRLGAQRA